METILNAPKGTMTELLNLIEQLTGRRFLGGHHRKELVTAWFNCEDHAWFSNRPFPIGTDSLPPDRRLAANLPDSESFFRIDLELRNHNAIPTDADISSALAEAQSLGAMGAVRTPHGLHVYLFASRPLTYGNGEVRHLLEALWPKHLALKVCSASWSRNNWSRHVSEMLFSQPDARVDVDSILRAAPSPKRVGKRFGRSGNGQKSSEPEKNGEFSQIMGSLLRERSREEIIPHLVYHSVEELDAAIVRTKTDPDYMINGVNTTGRSHHWFAGKVNRRKYWSKDRTQVGWVGLHSSSRQIQMDKSMRTQFGHSVQKFWNQYNRRYRTADDSDRIHLRNEAIGKALLWLEQSPTAEPFRRWHKQEFPGKDERGALHWWMAAHEDLGYLFDKYGPVGTGRAPVAHKCKRQVLRMLAKSSRNTPQLAKLLHYSTRQILRALQALEADGMAFSTGENRHKLWHRVQVADQDGFLDQGTPDIHVNPFGGSHANDLPRDEEDRDTVGVKMVELPRRRRLKGKSRGKRNAEMRRRAYVREIRRCKPLLRPADLLRLLGLPRYQAEFWWQRLEDFRQEWAEYCQWRWAAWAPGRRIPDFGEWLSTQREKVYCKLARKQGDRHLHSTISVRR